MDFEVFAEQLAKQEKRDSRKGVPLLSFDPGHTTGWCFFNGHELIDCGQIDTTTIPLAADNFNMLLSKFITNVVVYEEYRIYKGKAKHHAGSEVLTIQVIGCLQTLCSMLHIDTCTQPAHVAKGFCKDKRLKEWGFWQTSQRHANDSIRHACYHILFGDIKIRTGGKQSTSHTVG